PGRYDNPALSPDAHRIAVDRLNPDTGASDIWVIDLTRDGVASRFTFDAGPHMMPLWSPDGNRIIFKSGLQFRQKSSSGTGAEELVLDKTGAFGSPFGWSHDGTALWYASSSLATTLNFGLLSLPADA